VVRGEDIPDYDAIVIGAGLTGIYQTFLLDQEGMKVLGIEAGKDVGGTWFWNRYPGCRLDTESYAYGYLASSGIIPDWNWSENFAGQPELLRYANAAADAMDVRRLYKFQTRVTAAHYQQRENVWKVTRDDNEVVTCRYLISATGPLSASRMPDIKGIGSFKGESFHSSRWSTRQDGSQDSIDFTGSGVGREADPDRSSFWRKARADGNQLLRNLQQGLRSSRRYREEPIQEVTPTGIRTSERDYDLDVVIYATGFDAVTGSLDRIDIRGKDNTKLKDVWADGPTTYLGLQARGFPNFFTLVGPHNGSAFCNIGVCGALQVEWVTRMLAYLRQKACRIRNPRKKPRTSGQTRFTRTLRARY